MISNVKDIHKSLTMFAMDYDGAFPSDSLEGGPYELIHQGSEVLWQLEDADLFGEDFPLAEFLEVEGEVKGSWMYFPNQQNTDPSDLPLLISPESEGKVVILRIGGDAKAEPIEELKTILSTSRIDPIALTFPVEVEVQEATKEHPEN